LSKSRESCDRLGLIERLAPEQRESLVSSSNRFVNDHLWRDQRAAASGEQVRVDAALASD
jgi:hypothetical protein